MLTRRMLLKLLVFAIALTSAGAMTASVAARPQYSTFEQTRERFAVDESVDGSLGQPQWTHYDNLNPAGLSPEFESHASINDLIQDETRSGRPEGIPIGASAEWMVGTDVRLSTYGTSLKLPLLLGSKSPPPIVKIGFAYTDLSTGELLGVPEELYEYSAGMSWIKRINERWAVRTMLGVDFATDNFNTSSDAWRFTGGVFAIYKRSPRLSWTFGAIALGRSDLPVVPAIGAVWLPNPTTRIDLILPNPKANFLLADNGTRQHWAYLGGGLNGNTWAFERPGLVDDTLTYSDLRLVAGWEMRPSAPVNAPYVVGRKYIVEVGFAFSRDLEFENDSIEVSLDEAITFRLSTQF